VQPISSSNAIKEESHMRRSNSKNHSTAGRTTIVALAVALLLGPAGPAAADDHGHEGKAPPHSCCSTKKAGNETETVATYRRSLDEVAIPDLTLVRMDGRKVALRDELKPDMPVMLNFIFTTCTTICPVMSATFSQVQDRLGDDEHVRMVSISIDPEQDTPSRLRDYARRHEAGPGWHFLTGQVDEIEAVQRAFSAYRGSKFNHAPLTFLRAAGETRWVRIEGLAEAEAIVAEYRKLGGVL
jgi:protein SCO1/2